MVTLRSITVKISVETNKDSLDKVIELEVGETVDEFAERAREAIVSLADVS